MAQHYQPGSDAVLQWLDSATRFKVAGWSCERESILMLTAGLSFSTHAMTSQQAIAAFTAVSANDPQAALVATSFVLYRLGHGAFDP